MMPLAPSGATPRQPAAPGPGSLPSGAATESGAHRPSNVPSGARTYATSCPQGSTYGAASTAAPAATARAKAPRTSSVVNATSAFATWAPGAGRRSLVGNRHEAFGRTVRRDGESRRPASGELAELVLWIVEPARQSQRALVERERRRHRPVVDIQHYARQLHPSASDRVAVRRAAR